MLGPGCRPVTPSSSGSDSRVKQRRGNIKPRGWGTGASHQGGVSGWKADTPQGFPTCLDKARPKTGIFGSRTCGSAAGAQRGSLGAVIKLGLSSHPQGGAWQLLLALWGLRNFPPTCWVLQCQGICTSPFRRGFGSLGAATASNTGLGVCPARSVLLHAGHRCETHPGLGDEGLILAFPRQGQGRRLERSLRSALSEGGELSRAELPGREQAAGRFSRFCLPT